jgi:hypothetical protein
MGPSYIGEWVPSSSIATVEIVVHVVHACSRDPTHRILTTRLVAFVSDYDLLRAARPQHTVRELKSEHVRADNHGLTPARPGAQFSVTRAADCAEPVPALIGMALTYIRPVPLDGRLVGE